MVVTEFFKETESGTKLYKTYSDSNFYIRKVGTNEEYAAAIDVEGSSFTYIETSEVISADEAGE